MHAIVRRYEGIDTKRTDELKRKVDESLTPRLKKLDTVLPNPPKVTGGKVIVDEMKARA